jgi:hypothetical protein
MSIRDNSLRSLVEKWLGPTSECPVRLTRFSRTRADKTRYVGVRVSHANDALTVFFFRHEHGTWCVFPPGVTRPAIAANSGIPLATN